ncbi:hypothetical protein C7B70_25670 [Chlorogloea sp. CCALA 695]|nr:hypothetical protein C7B70_25670 [Chlorogloea sp. CCALA 695]
MVGEVNEGEVMEIFLFLFGLSCLIAIAWAIALLSHAVFGRKRRQQNRPQQHPSSKSTKLRQCQASQPTTPVLPVPPFEVVVLESGFTL